MSSSNFETPYVYIICHEEDGKMIAPIKIGVSDKPSTRLKSLTSGNPKKIIIYHQFATLSKNTAFQLEKFFMHMCKDSRLQGEWFQLVPEEAFIRMVQYIYITISRTKENYSESDVCKYVAQVCYERGGGHGNNIFLEFFEAAL